MRSGQRPISLENQINRLPPIISDTLVTGMQLLAEENAVLPSLETMEIADAPLHLQCTYGVKYSSKICNMKQSENFTCYSRAEENAVLPSSETRYSA